MERKKDFDKNQCCICGKTDDFVKNKEGRKVWQGMGLTSAKYGKLYFCKTCKGDKPSFMSLVSKYRRHSESTEEEILGCGKFDKENPELTRCCGDILFSNKVYLCSKCKKKKYSPEQEAIIAWLGFR